MSGQSRLSIRVRLALALHDSLELLLLPGLAAILPWPLCYRVLRWASRFENLYRERWEPALAAARTAGRVADDRTWARHARLVAMIDHADLYVLMTRPRRALAARFTRSGSWPSPGTAFIGYTFHWGAGFPALWDLAASGARAHPLVAAQPEDGAGVPIVRRWYYRMRNRWIARVLGAPTIDVGRDLRGVIAALRAGDGVIAAVDVPAQGAAFERVPFLDGSIEVPRAMFRLAADRGLPACVFVSDLDFVSGRRSVEVVPLAASDDAGELACQAYAHLSRRVAAAPEAWHFWGSWEHFHPQSVVASAAHAQAPVDVIVPVFGDAVLTRRCIESVLAASSDTPFELVLIADAPPDPAVLACCEAAAVDARVHLLRNESNRGFVFSANRGMALHADRDVVLLNADCEVADGWLDRLVACARAHPEAGTLTPFSNDATICSYPATGEESDLLPTLGLAGLDALFAREHAGRSVELPVGVGSCLFIRRACLEQTGYFDEEAFGRGYGEECDFCLRAAQHGWRHLLCADVFVFHAGGASFGEEKSVLVEAAQRVLRQRWPDYDQRIGDFVRRDPIRPLRDAITRVARETPGVRS
ncbi:glycosyltransferase [Pseudazoarcus pumilus]|nr:glycosyltransferase [Pseudazoarcus pumilus]